MKSSPLEFKVEEETEQRGDWRETRWMIKEGERDEERTEQVMRTVSTLTRGAAPLDFHTILFHRGGEVGWWWGDTVHGKTKRQRKK